MFCNANIFGGATLTLYFANIAVLSVSSACYKKERKFMQKLTCDYLGVARISGPLLFIENTQKISYGEVVKILGKDKVERKGRVIDVGENIAIVQVFEGTRDLAAIDTKVCFCGTPLQFKVSKDLLGRVLNGMGEPIDDAPFPFAGEFRDINGYSINPVCRLYPSDFIQTGISSIDGLNTLIRGQKIPIFSGNGLPHDFLATQIARQSKLLNSNEEFVVIFVAMGVKYDVADFFIKSFEESGALKNVTMFLNLANDPPEERIATPRVALTLAEHLAFDEGMHVLVIMTDMTNYCEALREIGSAKGEVPSRKGYPGYLYSDLASIYERTGRIIGKSGSITQIPILTMPNDDITHPIPDLTGFITEGQIVLDRFLFQKSIFPPINVGFSLSRLMKDGIGAGRTREDHHNLSSQLFTIYSRIENVRSLASIIGEEELSSYDQKCLQFGEVFEKEFINQGFYEDRTIGDTLSIGWKCLKTFPTQSLVRVTKEEIEKYYD